MSSSPNAPVPSEIHDDGHAHGGTHDHDHDDGHDDGHDDDHGAAIHAAPSPRGAASSRPLAIALGITAAFMLVEAAGGFVSGSLALLADAAHMATDVAALALALVAAWLARRPATRQRSWGFARAEVLAALANAALLVALTLWLFVETVHRLREPEPVETGLMLWVAVAGLLANAASYLVLQRGGAGHVHGHGHGHGHAHGDDGHGHGEAGMDLNTRSAMLHVLGDLLGSAAAIAAALVMMATGWWLADPILSALIGLLVLWGAWRVMAESVTVLLEATPPGLDPHAVHDAMAAMPGVAGIHDLHLWRIATGLDALSAHVELDGSLPWHDVLDELNALLRTRFRIGHATLQPEAALDGDDPWRGCTFDTPGGVAACRMSVDAGAGRRA